MSKSKRALGAILKSIRQGPERSPLFWWMLDNYENLAKAAEGTRIRWEPLRARFAELGLLDGAGKTPSAQNARQTWLSVRQLVESREAAARQRGTAGLQPSRLPATWRPPVAQHARPVVQPRYPPPGTPSPASTPPAAAPELNDKAQAMLDSLDRQLAHRDRFINPPRRKD